MFVCSLADFDDEVEDSSKFVSDQTSNETVSLLTCAAITQEENLRLWRSVCENKLLANTVFFLFLNKSDLLEAKLKAGEHDCPARGECFLTFIRDFLRLIC